MKKLPLVSIVTPAYNQAEYLAETIESVLAQDYPNIEYIVLDDGSSDNTLDVLKRYDGRLRYESHANMGQARTLNRGWGMSSGSLIGYLSSDDRLRPHAVSRMVQALSQNAVAVAYCDFELIDAKGRAFRTVRTENFDRERLTIDLVCQPGPGALFRRDIFDRAGGWAENLHQTPDFEFWLRASRFGPFVRVPELLAEYRIHENSASFRPVAVERSMEIVAVMTSYWGAQISAEAKQSMAAAHLMASRSHAQSRRVWDSFMEWSKAIHCKPSLLLKPRSWRTLASGFLRRFAYYLRKRDR